MADRKCRVTIDGEVREYARGTAYQEIAGEFSRNMNIRSYLSLSIVFISRN